MTDEMTVPDLSHSTLTELFSLYRAILAELRRREIVRTDNAPAGDYAEYLVAQACKGHLAPNSEKSYDMLSADRKRLQVKARVVSVPPKPSQLQLSPFRSFDFDWAVIVLLSDKDYSVWRAAKIPAAIVEAAAAHNSHVNGKVVLARPELLNHPESVDVTNLVRAIQKVEPGEFDDTQASNAGSTS